MHNNVVGEGTQAEDAQPQDPEQPVSGSGQGSATAMARLKLQREHIARQQPADDASPGGRKHDPQR